MLACLRVSDVAASVKFFTNELGMRTLPLPLARQPGSDFEPPQPPGSAYVGYGVDSFGLLLVPGAKGDPPLSVGNALAGFTVVYDDAPEQIDALPPLARAAATATEKGTAQRVLSPDGYPFILKSLREHEKTATQSMS